MVYHLQTKGLVEQFNKALKQMLYKYVQENMSDWPLCLRFLLFALWEVLQASLEGLSFELLYGWHPWLFVCYWMS